MGNTDKIKSVAERLLLNSKTLKEWIEEKNIDLSGLSDEEIADQFIEWFVETQPCPVTKEKKEMEATKLNWHKPEDLLPPEGKYVLVRHNMGNWHDDTDQDDVNCVVAKMTHGISLEERDALPEGDTRKI